MKNEKEIKTNEEKEVAANGEKNENNKKKFSKKSIFYLLLGLVLCILASLSPVISPYLVDWIDFDTPTMKNIERIAMTVLGTGFWLACIWFACDTLTEDFKKTIKEIKEKWNNK